MPPQVSPELRKVQEQTNKMLALKGVLQTVDRALSGVEDLTVSIEEASWNTPNAPAWTDGKKISMLRERVVKVFEEQDLPNAILTFKGTNFHELAHVLFTPRSDDQIGKWIKSTGYRYKWAWNALEDQRIETLYTALYPPTVPYFRNSAYRWLLNDIVGNDKFYRIYSLIGGRKYLERDIRRQARQAFVNHYGPEVADQLDTVVNEYVALPLPGSQDRAIELVEEFYNLLRGTDLSDFMDQQDECGGAGAGSEGEVDPEKVVKAAARVREQVAKEQEQDKADGPQERQEQPQAPSSGGYPEDDKDEDEGDSPAPSAGGYPEDDAEDSDDFPWEQDDSDDSDSGEGDEGDQDGPESNQDGDADGSGDQDGDQAEGEAGGEQGQDGDGDSDDAGQTEAKANDGKSGTGASDGNEEVPAKDPAEALQESINEALADTLTDEGLRNDIDRTVEAFKANAAGKGEAEVQPSYDRFEDVDAEQVTIETVRRMIAQLRMLKTDAEATWIRERQTGSRVNTNHVIRHVADPTHLEIFEEWDEGYEEEAKTEVVIAIDLSISMADILPQCSQALWALKKSLDKAEIPTTVLGFSAGNVLLYGRGEKIKGLKVRQFQTWGGTNPRATMLYAHRLLARSTATNKVLIAITDGKWQGFKGDGADPENVVEDIRKRGGSTLLFGVSGYRTEENEHNFELTADITEIPDMVRIIRELVVNIQRKAANKK